MTSLTSGSCPSAGAGAAGTEPSGPIPSPRGPGEVPAATPTFSPRSPTSTSWPRRLAWTRSPSASTTWPTRG
ncbi:MAG: hypothetical protein MZU91_11610 [Desulfosudis oleivorans]|nr:hypothetical protein [Desulfosudis oleivorans]